MPLITDPLRTVELNLWVSGQGGGFAAPCSYTALGWVDETGEVSGGLVFHTANRVNCVVNIALKKGAYHKGLILAGLRYAFGQLALRRLTFYVSQPNIASINLVQGLGAIHEATLRDAEPEGDVHIYALFADSCPIWSRIRGKNSRRTPFT